ncbi:delta3,5-Delta2,4-dienoyl-CoA isomerase, mitochondrial [Octopus vulgaris]|uniref:Delta(3,5)-Delta(2,4)-dienoyl-CoA isomerase, mitochondrial n=2 Tax=Octopus vulgaris TaxID=6645 RepID=A0AA36BAL3_OCTVU|nr:delta3,5-Delta2,4-dienoyl-CoA isomerase, mitochondrial [Octopus vulgaris]
MGSLTRLSFTTRLLGTKYGLYRTMTVAATDYQYENLKVTKPSDWVFHVEFNRPDKRNAINRELSEDVISAFKKLSYDPDCRVVVLSGAGRVFTAGVDFASLAEVYQETGDMEVSRRAFALYKTIKDFQDTCSAFEKCPKPVISAVHGACIGFGVDLISACDMRYCTKDAWFQVKEVDFGLAADVGTLQRLPRIIGNQSLVRELAYTARAITSDEARDVGLVSRVFDDKAQLIKAVLDIASVIAKKSPIAIQTTKKSLLYSQDHSVQDGLDNIAALNQVMLQSEDLMKSIAEKSPIFSKL